MTATWGSLTKTRVCMGNEYSGILDHLCASSFSLHRVNQWLRNVYMMTGVPYTSGGEPVTQCDQWLLYYPRILRVCMGLSTDLMLINYGQCTNVCIWNYNAFCVMVLLILARQSMYLELQRIMYYGLINSGTPIPVFGITTHYVLWSY